MSGGKEDAVVKLYGFRMKNACFLAICQEKYLVYLYLDLRPQLLEVFQGFLLPGYLLVPEDFQSDLLRLSRRYDEFADGIDASAV